MDWPLTGALTGVGVLTCAVGFAAYALVWSDPEPAKKPPAAHLLAPFGNRTLPSTETSSITVVPASGPASLPPRPREPTEPALSSRTKRPPVQKPAPEAPAKSAAEPEPKGMKLASVPPAAKAPTPEPHVEPERWKVTTTQKASYFNLGGHVDKSGIVDGLASPRLREALKQNKNFDKLPPPIKAHLNGTQNIDLAKLAPYRGLLGMDDRLMEEQGVRFERMAQSR
jgi:hypothetical protein